MSDVHGGGYFIRDGQNAPAPGLAGATVDVPNDDPYSNTGNATTELTDDGGAIVDLDPRKYPSPAFGVHDANLADALDDGELSTIAEELLEAVQTDLQSRGDWEAWYIDGIKLLGLKPEERSEPFEGASAVTSPVLIEAIVRFQAQARAELLPAAGPAKTQIIGLATPPLIDQAQRVKRALNYYCTETATEFYPEFDRMLLMLPMSGSTFKVVENCPLRGRPVCDFVTADDMIVSYNTTSVDQAQRITRRQYPSRGDLLRLMLAGHYRAVDLQTPELDDDAIRRAVDALEGRSSDIVTGKDELHCTYTSYCYRDLTKFEHTVAGKQTGIPLPYKIVIETTTRKVLRIERNWEDGDPNHRAVLPIQKYDYLPGLGFYGLGLTHLIGGSAKAATAILRQLIDAGTLANLPGGLVVKGMRVEDNDIPINPGEWREIETNGLAINNAVVPLPYKEPSAVLAQLLAGVVSDAQRLAGTADIAVGDGRQDAPVGTTVALIDQATKVLSSVHKRLHVSLRGELRMLAKLFAKDPQSVWTFRGAGFQGQATGADFSDIIDVIPVSDPNIPSQSQRILQQQAVMQLVAQSPELYNKKNAHMRMLQVLDVDTEGLMNPDPPQAVPMDPITENQNALQGVPLKAGDAQDHVSHMQVHYQFLMTPGVMMTPAGAPLKAHLADHLALLYRASLMGAMGQPLPPPGQPLPPEQEAQLSQQVAMVSQQVTQQLTQQLGSMFGADQGQQATVAVQHEANQVKMQDIQAKTEDGLRKAQNAQTQNDAEVQKLLIQSEDHQAERASRERLGDQKLQAEQIRASVAHLQPAMPGPSTI